MTLVVFTGGARCGKTAIAENLAFQRALATGQHVTAAVFGNAFNDSELAEQISNAQAARPHSFETMEAYGDPAWLDHVAPDDILLVDCLGTALMALIDSYEADYEAYEDSLDDSEDKHIARLFSETIQRLITRPGDTIIVTNQVGSGLAAQYDSARLCRNLLGYANNELIVSADAAYLVFCGRLIDLTTLPDSTQWPED
jgi:adenosylcobinamide kinase/adenosylcobinamide-phosphate guanylyltransferase